MIPSRPREFGGGLAPIFLLISALVTGGLPLVAGPRDASPSFLEYNRDGVAPLSKRSGRVSMGSSPADWSGDGRLDLLADQRVYFQREDGVFEKGEHLQFLRWSADVELADLTGDGLRDIVESRWGRPEIRLFRNTGEPGDPRFGEAEVIATAETIDRARPEDRKPVTSAHPHVVDWNGNGLPDLLVVCRDIWTDYFPYHPTRDIGQRGGRTTFGQIYGEVYFLPNRGTAERPRFPEAFPVLLENDPLTVFGISAPVTVDWNGNGLLDLIVTQEAMPPLLFLNTGTREEPLLAQPRHLYLDYPGIYSKISVVDWTGNGLFDLLVSSEDGEFVFFNEGEPGDPYFSGKYEVLQEVADKIWVPSGFASPWAVDLTGDGRRDLVTGSADGHFRLFRNLGGGKAPSFSGPEYLRHPCGRPIRIQVDMGYHAQGPVERFWGYSSPVVVDWNGNGKLDILSAQIGRAGYLFYENVGGEDERVWAEPVLLEAGGRIIRTTGHARMRPAVVDWNGDRLADLVAVNDRHEYVLYLRERGEDGQLRLEKERTLRFQDGSPVTFTAPDDIVGRRDSVSVADWNGDGNWDIITGLNSATGGFAFAENTGTNEEPVFAPGREMTDRDGVGLRASAGRLLDGFRHNPHIQVTDWNGDGVLDLLVGQDLGFILFYDGERLPR